MSLRARLLAGMVLIGIALTVTAFATTSTTEHHLVAQVDAQLKSTGDPLRGYNPDGGDFGGPGGGPQRLSAVYVIAVDSTGTMTVLQTPNFSETVPPLPLIDGQKALKYADTSHAFTVSSSGSSLRYRVLARDDERVGGAVLIALPLGDVDTTVHQLVALETIVTLMIIAVLALVTWWVMRLGVRPIKQMTEAATVIAAGDLSHRVPDGATGTEAAALGTALNKMMGHIEEAFDERTRSEARLRQFIADASHELRTPVTTIRGYAELYRAGALKTEPDLSEAMRRTEQEAIRMGTLVDDLLHLARLDQGRPLERNPVNLAAVAEDAVRDARAVDPERSIVATTQPLTVVGDDGRLRQVVANLIGNALVHTDPGTPIEVHVSRQDGRAVLEVTDHGAGMEPEVAARAFERFFRADPSRSRHRGGSGLGLSIVRATINAHGGTVSLDTNPGQGTTVRVELPLATPA